MFGLGLNIWGICFKIYTIIFSQPTFFWITPSPVSSQAFAMLLKHSALALLTSALALAAPHAKRKVAFNWGSDKIRGVNIGGWLVLEPCVNLLLNLLPRKI